MLSCSIACNEAITEEQHSEFVAIKEEYPDEEDEDSGDYGSLLSNAWL